MMKTKIINFLIVVFIIVLISWFTEINYNNLSFEENRSAYLGITSMGLMLVAMLSLRRQQKNKSSD